MAWHAHASGTRAKYVRDPIGDWPGDLAEVRKSCGAIVYSGPIAQRKPMHGAARRWVLGVDTETYNDDGRVGLKTIQAEGRAYVQRPGSAAWLPDTGSGTLRVYAVAHLDQDDVRATDGAVDDFFEIVERLTAGESRVSYQCWFYNLQFDFSYFENWFCQHYRWRGVQDDRRRQLARGEAKALQSPMSCYGVQFCDQKGAAWEWKDAGNYARGGLASVARALGCPAAKGDRPLDLLTRRAYPTGREWSYAMLDAEVTRQVAERLCLLDLSIGETWTIAGCARKAYLAADAGGHVLDTSFERTGDDFYGTRDKREIDRIKDRWETIFRPSNRGGLTISVRTGMYPDVDHIDRISMHPSNMMSALPYGEPLDEPPEDGPYTSYIFLKGDFRVKTGHIPIMQFSTIKACDRYTLDEPIRPSRPTPSFQLDGSWGFWEEELRCIDRNYHFDGAIEKIYYMRKRPMMGIQAYIRAMAAIKREEKKKGKGPKYLMAKLLQNALYGKLLERPDGEAVEYADTPEGWRRVKATETGRATWALPIGSYVVTMSRVVLATLMQDLEDASPGCVIYGDTDSVFFKHFDGWEHLVDLGDQLGQWDLEHEHVAMNAVAPKKYQLLSADGSVETKCAGMRGPARRRLAYGQLAIGLEVQQVKSVRDPATMYIRLEDRPYVVRDNVEVMHGHRGRRGVLERPEACRPLEQRRRHRCDVRKGYGQVVRHGPYAVARVAGRRAQRGNLQVQRRGAERGDADSPGVVG